MPTDLDLDALSVAVEGWGKGAEYRLDVDDFTVKVDCESFPDCDFATFHFDNAAADFLRLWTAAPALIAQARDAARLARRVEALEGVLRDAVVAMAWLPSTDTVNDEIDRLRLLLPEAETSGSVCRNYSPWASPVDSDGREVDPRACMVCGGTKKQHDARSLLTPADGVDDAG